MTSLISAASGSRSMLWPRRRWSRRTPPLMNPGDSCSIGEWWAEHLPAERASRRQEELACAEERLRCRRVGRDYPSETVPEDVEASAPQNPEVSVTLVPVTFSNSGDGSRERCTLCLEEYCHGENLVELPACRHHFHDGCLRPWLALSSLCPLCKGHMEDEPHDPQ